MNKNLIIAFTLIFISISSSFAMDTVWTKQINNGLIKSVKFTNKGNELITNGGIRIHNYKGGDFIWGDSLLNFWNIKSQSLLKTIKIPDFILSYDLSPDENNLYIGHIKGDDRDNLIYLKKYDIIKDSILWSTPINVIGVSSPDLLSMFVKCFNDGKRILSTVFYGYSFMQNFPVYMGYAIDGGYSLINDDGDTLKTKIIKMYYMGGSNGIVSFDILDSNYFFSEYFYLDDGDIGMTPFKRTNISLTNSDLYWTIATFYECSYFYKNYVDYCEKFDYLKISPNKKYLVASSDRSIYIFNLENGLINIDSSVYKTQVTTFAFTNDSKSIIYGDSTGNIRILDFDTETITDSAKIPTNALIRCIDVSPDSVHFATASDDGVLRLWGLNNINSVDENKWNNKDFDIEIYPNPFSDYVSIKYYLTVPTSIRICVFDVFGNEISEIINAVKEGGEIVTRFSGESLPIGIYFLNINIGQRKIVKKIAIIR
jgi:WD40 repeat protein